MDPYQACPCGSGKNFKWCCQSYFAAVEKARNQHGRGQHESALRTMQQLVEKHPGSAPVLGFQAEMFYLNQRNDEADDAILKAFAINPDFPLGHWLRGNLRKDEGEIVGALIEFRKAAELYDPKSIEILAQIHAEIFDIEMRMNRVLAARASLERAVHCSPASKELRDAFDALFGSNSRLPNCACTAYSFRTAEPSRIEAWQAALSSQKQNRFSETAAAFEKLTAAVADDAAAWFNLGLVRAWMGENPQAVEALQRSVELESDEAKNTEAGALIEVLRCAVGMEDRSDYIEHRVFFQISNSEPLLRLLDELQKKSRLTAVQQDQENGTLTAWILEKTPLFGSEVPAAKLGSYLFIVGNILRLWHPNEDSVRKVADEFAPKLAGSASPPVHERGNGNFPDVTLEALLFPTRDCDPELMRVKMEEQARSYFEEVWLHRSLKALSGASPINAANHPIYRKQLLGVLRFVEDCYIRSSPYIEEGEAKQVVLLYDFARLRRKLGLGGEALPATAAVQKIDELSVPELASLDVEKLDDEQIERAFRASLKLDARDLAGKFARLGVNRPIDAGIADRYPYYKHLIQLAHAENDSNAVAALLEEGERADAESNDGKRRDEYTQRRGLFHAKQGEIDKAYELFHSLLAQSPDDLKHYGPAIEAMLAHKKGLWALQFAELGLAKARSQNNRDSERHFMELAAAAKKQIG